MFISFVGNTCGEALKDQIYMIKVGWHILFQFTSILDSYTKRIFFM